MACHPCLTIFCVLFFGCCGWLLSMFLIAPFYFSIKWSEKYAIEKAITIGLPCFGAVSGFIIACNSKGPAKGQQSNGQQIPERPEPRAVPDPRPVLPPTHAGPPDLEAQVMAKDQRATDVFNLNLSHPAAPAPTAHNLSSGSTSSLRNSESITSLPPYAAQDPEYPTVPAPSYSRNDRLSRATGETGPYCQLCRTRHSKATYVNHSG